jgi:uncharacterized membrane protein YjjP (DUF1212 family)
MVISMLFSVFGDVVKRYFVPAVLITFIISLLNGFVASLAGGHFWLASEYAAIACGVVALIGSLVVTFSVVYSRDGFI